MSSLSSTATKMMSSGTLYWYVELLLSQSVCMCMANNPCQDSSRPSTVGVAFSAVDDHPWCECCVLSTFLCLSVFFLSIPEDSVKERLTLRRVDPTTGER